MAKYIVEYQVTRRVTVKAASKLEAAEAALHLERLIGEPNEPTFDSKVTPLSVRVFPLPDGDEDERDGA